MQDVNLAYELFLNKLQEYISQSTIIKHIKHLKKNKPWITNGLIVSIKKKRSYEKKNSYGTKPMKFCKTNINNIEIQLQKFIKKTKQDCYTKKNSRSW